MDILIPNSWLKKFLDTKAKPNEIAKYLSLSGPSVERIIKEIDGDSIYHIEVTTNRADAASVLGIAREASAILPRFGIKAKLRQIKSKTAKRKLVNKVDYLEASADASLCPRFTAVLIKNAAIKESPNEIKSLLEKAGVRPINNIVDVSNFVMHELGQPVHTFDYDKIAGHKMILRNSKKGEVITTLDGKKFTLSGGDIVIEDGKGRLIDLCGIMGGENSAIDKKTKNVLLFVQTYNPHKIRQTSMNLAQRSEAAVLFEKGLNPEQVEPAMMRAIELLENLSGGKAEAEILDIYPSPYKGKSVSTNLQELKSIIGINLSKSDIKKYLESLGFGVKWHADNITVSVPSFRSNDIGIPEDIAEEVARIYGYHNLPSIIMSGSLPAPKEDSIFKFEAKVKQTLKSLGAVEVYNLSLTDKASAGEGALKLANPLGLESEYLRMSLMPSLIANISANPQEKGSIHFFELSNVYMPRKNDLPEERLTLGGIIKGNEYRQNKGIVEALLDEMNIEYQSEINDRSGFLPNQRLEIISDKTKIGEYGNLESGSFYYEFNLEKLMNAKKVVLKFKETPKFPPQIESLTVVFPSKTKIGEAQNAILQTDKKVFKAELKDIYKDSYTFEVWFQDESKTLNDSEVKEVRSKVIQVLKSKFGGSVKE